MNEAHTSSTGAPTNAWANYYQRINDWLSSVSKTLAQIRKGVTDGSEAAAGDIGEYMSATSGIVSLANTVTANLATLNLTAGDWDVTGAVTFSASAGTHLSFGIGIGSTGDASDHRHQPGHGDGGAALQRHQHDRSVAAGTGGVQRHSVGGRPDTRAENAIVRRFVQVANGVETLP